jgi:DNA repair exonuclease SbcCD ATPase subunit
MLDRVHLHFFQQHRDLEVSLGGGLTAIRGANEAGKSTLLRGICYALFGVKAMPDTLESLVTWGEDVKKLKSEVSFTADHVQYHVKRSKSGAELNYEGGKVTGQNEVTAFICRLLKVDAAAAPRLMLSNQNEIRGALEAGPKETTALIERLADFNQIDELIDLMQEKLSLGSVGGVEAAIDNERQRLEAAREAAVAPDLPMLDYAIENQQEGLQREKGALARVEESVEAAAKALSEGKVAQAERQAVLDQIKAAGDRMTAIDSETGKLRATKAPDNVEAEIQRRRDAITQEERRAELQGRKERIAEVDAEVRRFEAVAAPQGDVEALRQRIGAAERHAELREKFEKVKPYTVDSEVRAVEGFETTMEKLEAGIEKTSAEIVGLRRRAEKCRSDAALLRQQITNGACGFCNQDFSEVPAVKAKNAELEARASLLCAEADSLDGDAHTLQDGVEHAREVREWSKPVLAVLAVVGPLAEAVDGALPPVLRWTGPDVSDAPEDVKVLQRQIEEIEAAQRAFDRAQAKLETLRAERANLAKDLPETLPPAADVKALRREIRDLEAARDAYTLAQARIEALRSEFDRLDSQIAQANTALDDHPAVDVAALQRAADGARAKLEPARAAVRSVEQALTAARQAKVDAVSTYERALRAVEDAKAALQQRQKELEELRFNNKLLKDVRSARPIITDKLWNMVLGAVSRYFSEMRGVESLVTKGQDGFMVDGHVVSPVTLSGSALDILGLAIRVALVKTFLPACPFFVLDEPAQGCDDNRTANLLSFLSACGFQQVLLVTHEDTSESVAQNMITIGG